MFSLECSSSRHTVDCFLASLLSLFKCHVLISLPWSLHLKLQPISSHFSALLLFSMQLNTNMLYILLICFLFVSYWNISPMGASFSICFTDVFLTTKTGWQTMDIECIFVLLMNKYILPQWCTLWFFKWQKKSP